MMALKLLVGAALVAGACGAPAMADGCKQDIAACLAIYSDDYTESDKRAIKGYYSSILAAVSQKGEGRRLAGGGTATVVVHSADGVAVMDPTNDVDALLKAVDDNLQGDPGNLMKFQSAIMNPCLKGLGGEPKIFPYPFAMEASPAAARVLRGGASGGRSHATHRNLDAQRMAQLEEESTRVIKNMFDANGNGVADGCEGAM